MSSQPLQRFVRSAWTLLLFQVAAAVLAVGVTAWAAFQVRPLLEQRETLNTEIAQLATEREQLTQQRQTLITENEQLAERLTRGRQQARVEAADIVRRGINAFHAGRRATAPAERNANFQRAVASYDEALRLDPDNAYVLDLKSYSQFMMGDLEGAIASVQAALAADPNYIYGYSELARYACAARRFDVAVQAFNDAKAQTGGSDPGFIGLMQQDGEFANLCGSVRAQFAP